MRYLFRAFPQVSYDICILDSSSIQELSFKNAEYYEISCTECVYAPS